MKHEFVLHVPDIDEAGKHYHFPVRREWLTSVLKGTEVSADEQAPEGELDIRVHKQGADILLRGHVTVGLVTECARCLAPAKIKADADLTSLLTARGSDLRPEPDEVELTPEEIEREFFTGDQIVLDEVVREHLLLEVPIKPLCTEDCPGIPVPAAVAGPVETTGGVDPRLAPLLKLVEKTKSSKE